MYKTTYYKPKMQRLKQTRNALCTLNFPFLYDNYYYCLILINYQARK